MKYIILSALCITMHAFADAPANIGPAETASKIIAEATAPAVTTDDNAYTTQNNGIPWNRERFDSERLVRHDTFDPALKVAYSYSLSFVGGSFGSFAQQSLMAHFAYEFTPNLHLYANVGLWMPLLNNLQNGVHIAREDLRQGNVNVLIPDIALEYKPSENTVLRISYVNERDSFKAYGPHSILHSDNTWRNPLYRR
jgi:hypothetical protein